jgi:hypothetical protein
VRISPPDLPFSRPRITFLTKANYNPSMRFGRVHFAIVLLGLLYGGKTEHGQTAPPGYPEYPVPQVTLEIVGGRGRLSSATSAYYQITFRSFTSLDGPSEYSSSEIDLTGPQRFFYAVVNPGFVFLDGNFWRVDLLGIRLFNNETDFTTQSGFHLKLQDSWKDGIGVFHIESGPSSGDARTDFMKLFNELLADARTQFITPLDTSLTGGPIGEAGHICYTGNTDQLFLQNRIPDYTDEELARLDLAVISRGGRTRVRWTSPKSTTRDGFLQILKTAGVDAEFEITGCPL